jgi:signal transduction histidine kinase/DNA-binding response OmpR family regulator
LIQQKSDKIKGDILVVDDDLPSLRLLSGILAEQGYQVRSARNGATAIMMIGAEVPDLILLDIQMPDMNGFQVCEQLKQRPDTMNIPVLFISAGDDVANKVKGFEIGAVDYITKPFQEPEILARIKTHLNLSRLYTELAEANSRLQTEILQREQAQLALKSSEASLRSQYQGFPVATTTWKRDGDDLVLIDYNLAAVALTRGKIAEIRGIYAREFYRDQPEVLEDLMRCMVEKRSIEREFEHTFLFSDETKHLAAKYAYIPSDLVLMHTEDISERKRMEKQLMMHLEELDVLHRISKTVISSQDLSTALKEICQTVCDLFEARLTIIALQARDGSEFKGLVGYEKKEGRFSFSATETRLSGLPVSQELLTEGKALVVTNFDDVPLPGPTREYVQMANLQSCLIVPLITRRTTLGVLLLCKDEKNTTFNPYEINLAETIANDISAAIENERLILQARQAAVDAERQRLARELHDSVTQSIYSLILLSSGWESMARQGTLVDPAESFRSLGDVGQQALREMRLLLHQLRPSIVEEEGLVKALQQRLDQVERRANIDTELTVQGNLQALPKNVEDQLFNIAQEALNNSLRHARARQVKVRLEEGQGRIKLVVEDDGTGFDTHAKYAGMGLETMRERARSIQGRIELDSELNRGTRVTIEAMAMKDEEKDEI